MVSVVLWLLSLADCLDFSQGTIKPDIVFFGENLPESFHRHYQDAAEADLLIVMGTSLEVNLHAWIVEFYLAWGASSHQFSYLKLQVYPFAGIADEVSSGTPRILLNMDVVGSFGSRESDGIITGDIEDSVRRLAKECGWLHELEQLVKQNERASTGPFPHSSLWSLPCQQLAIACQCSIAYGGFFFMYEMPFFFSPGFLSPYAILTIYNWVKTLMVLGKKAVGPPSL